MCFDEVSVNSKQEMNEVGYKKGQENSCLS